MSSAAHFLYGVSMVKSLFGISSKMIKSINAYMVDLASFLWEKGKQCRPRSDAAGASDQDLHCLLTECSIKI